MKARGENSPRGVELMVYSPHCSRAACGLGATFCFKSFPICMPHLKWKPESSQSNYSDYFVRSMHYSFETTPQNLRNYKHFDRMELIRY